MFASPLDNLASNKKALAAVGLGGGFLFLCSGFLVMALVTVGVLNRNAPDKFSVATTQPAAPSPNSTAPARPGKSEVDGDEAPNITLRTFLDEIRAGQWERAHNLSTFEYQARISIEDFRTTMIKKRLRNWKALDFRTDGRTVATRKVRGKLELADGRLLPFEIELVDENDGWKVNVFDFHD
jgi:hypothetical protein